MPCQFQHVIADSGEQVRTASGRMPWRASKGFGLPLFGVPVPDRKRRFGQARYVKADVTVEGCSRLYERTGDSRMWARYHFCLDCVSTVIMKMRIHRVYAIPVGAFADPAFPAPQRSIH